MNLEYDQDADAAYLYLRHPLKDGEVKKTVEVQKNIILDFDANNKLVGIEILSASKMVGKDVLAESKIIA